MHPLNIQYESSRSDQPNITFETTGIQCGGPNHRGYATLVIEMHNPDMKVSVNSGSIVVDEASKVSIMIAGDSGTEGLAIALLELGRRLLLSRPK